ncbi:hypothetical protein C6502_17785 [Candidatus Poribacteria bacterium]|nr:MAG: hypothetical protein C6502_17785 [Candidatus Poribacteria bacterium]
MKNREIYAVSVILITVGICGVGWFFLREHPAELLPGHQNATQNRKYKEEIAKNSQVPQLEQKPDGNREEDTLTIYQKMARRGKRTIMAMYSEEELATPEMQKLLEAMDSPEYVEYFKEHPSSRRWDNFLESKGIPVDREVYNETFRMYFPTGEPEAYEPQMRQKLAEMFLAAEPVDLTDSYAAARQRGKVVLEFARKDSRNLAWYTAQFQNEDWEWFSEEEREGVGRNAAREWISDVQRNAANIVAAAEQAGVDVPETQASAPSWDMSSVMESPSAPSDATTGKGPSISPAIDTLAAPAIPNPETDAAATRAPDLTDVSKAPTALPTVEGLEASLKEQFSSERFERAMSTLDRYGPEEGLRRLRENDPEVAKQIERHRNRSRSKDSDKSEEEVSR